MRKFFIIFSKIVHTLRKSTGLFEILVNLNPLKIEQNRKICGFE